MNGKKMPLTAALPLLAALIAAVLLALWRPQVSEEAERAALEAVSAYERRHPEERAKTIVVVDYTQPSYSRRMLVIEKNTGTRTSYRVAHGKNSGALHARIFSNRSGSNMSSLGLYKTGEVYRGEHGLAIRLHGLDSLHNGNAHARDIVLHAAWYVSLPVVIENLLTLQGPRIGRSNGCFVVAPRVIDDVIGKLSQRAFIYAYGEEEAL